MCFCSLISPCAGERCSWARLPTDTDAGCVIGGQRGLATGFVPWCGVVGREIRKVLKQQTLLASFLLKHRCLRHVVIVVWAVTFGGNVQSPVVSFFYLEIGMSPVEIGNAGFISMACLLISSPVYGYVLDRKGAYEALLLSLCVCGVGCFGRALCSTPAAVYFAAVLLGFGSSFETMSLATLSRSLPPYRRSLIVSGFLLQIKLVALSARLVYPAWAYAVEHMLLISQELARHRIAMGLCIVPCIIGFWWLAFQRKAFLALETSVKAGGWVGEGVGGGSGAEDEPLRPCRVSSDSMCDVERSSSMCGVDSGGGDSSAGHMQKEPYIPSK